MDDSSINETAEISENKTGEMSDRSVENEKSVNDTTMNKTEGIGCQPSFMDDSSINETFEKSTEIITESNRTTDNNGMILCTAVHCHT